MAAEGWLPCRCFASVPLHIREIFLFAGREGSATLAPGLIKGIIASLLALTDTHILQGKTVRKTERM